MNNVAGFLSNHLGVGRLPVTIIAIVEDQETAGKLLRSYDLSGKFTVFGVSEF